MRLKTVPAAVAFAVAMFAALPVPAGAGEGASAKLFENKIWSDVPAQSFNADWSIPADSAENARGWEYEGFPVGNGRIGAMVLGNPVRERLALNEISLWSGGENAGGNGSGYEYGPLAGRDKFGSFQPFADLLIADKNFENADENSGKSGNESGGNDVSAVKNFVRSLSLSEAIARTSFERGGTRFSGEVFAAENPSVIAVVRRASKRGKISTTLALSPKHTCKIVPRGGNTLALSGTLANGMRFAAQVTVVAKGGKIRTLGGNGGKIRVSYVGEENEMRAVCDGAALPKIEVVGADEMLVLVALHTDYALNFRKNWKSAADPAKTAAGTIAAALKAAADVPAFRKAHVAAHRKLFARCKIDLGETDAATAALPTAQRLARYRETHADPDLEETLFQFGRYLLISSSRNSLPANLQGLWNDKVHAPWASDYHNNINVQEAYWAAETTNLSECHLPLLNFIAEIAPVARAAAKREFGEKTRGWTARISQNPWGAGGWEMWNVPVNAWYALHFWEHFQFMQDREFLLKKAFPLMLEACDFWETRLKALGADGDRFATSDAGCDISQLAGMPAGTLVAPAGWSHEWGPIEDGIAFDQQLVRELFSDTLAAAKILGKNSARTKKIAAMLARLAPDKIAPGGYLQEWLIDRPEMVSGQRHTSHLFAVFPGSGISVAKTPELAAAAQKSLELRGSDGDSRRSWTWPWRTALWARLKNGEKAHENIVGLLSFNTLPNLLTTHPPFQADGNFAFPAGVAEMLVQSHAGEIELLPAPCTAWPSGSVRGLKARGNVTVNFTWKNGKVTHWELLSPLPQKVALVVNGTRKIVTPKAPQTAQKSDSEAVPAHGLHD